MHSFEYLELDVIRWAEARRIIPNSSAASQFVKAVSEIGELADGINKNDLPLIKDSVGDVLVCLINMCALLDISITDCLRLAYEEIKDRKGTLLPNGVFVKE